LSFGSTAGVLAPQRLKGLVAAEAEKVAAKYTVALPLTPVECPKDLNRLGSAERNLQQAKALRAERALSVKVS